MILTHHGIDSMPSFVNIGGKNYPFVKIGNLFVTTSSYNVPTTHSVLPENGTDMFGLLYPAYDMFNEIIPILPTGWRVPDKSDFTYLKTNISNLADDYISQDKGGNDTTRFNAQLLGYKNRDDVYVYNGSKSLFWSQSPREDGTTTWNLDITKNSTIDTEDYSRGTSANLSSTAFEIRFCKTA